MAGSPSTPSSSDEGLSATAANVLMGLVAFVAVLSLLFEWAQHMIMKIMSRKHDPELFIKLAEGFFRELTILGFVGVVLHIIERSNILESLANTLELGHYELLHHFHLVHLIVFLVMVTYVLIVSLLTWRLSAVVVEWNAAEYANTARVCIAVDRAKEMHNKAKKTLIELYHYKLLRFSFLFPYAGGIDPKKRGADPRTFPFHKYLRNCLVEDTIRIVNPSKAVTIGLLGLAMAARPLYTLGGTYLMLAVVVMVLLLDLGLLLLTRHVRRIFVALLPAKLPLSFVEQFEDTNGGISKREVDSARSGALARTYTMQLEDKAEDRLRKLHDTIGAVWTVNRAVKRFRKNASRISVAPVESQEEAVAEDQESDIRSAVPNSAVGSFRLEGGGGDCSGSDDESARGSVAVDLAGAIVSNGKGDPNAMENCSGSLEGSGTKGIGKSRSVRMDVPEAAGEESTKSLVSSGEESQQSELLPPPFLLRGHFGMITGAATGTGWIPLLTSRLYLLITGTDAPNQQESMFWFWANGPTFIFGVLQLILLLDAVLLSLVIRILVLGINGELFPDDDAETDHSAELALVDVFAGIVVILIFHQIWRMVPGFLYYFTPATATELMKRANIIEQTVEKEVRVKRLRFLRIFRALRNKVVLDEARDAILASQTEGRPNPTYNLQESLFELAPAAASTVDDEFDAVAERWSAVDRMANRMRRSTRMSRRLHVPGVTELVFKLYDIDHNGRLQRDELRRAIVAQGINRGDAEVVLNDWVDIFDVDGDGCLNLREFKNLVAVLEYLESSFDAPACRKWLARVFKVSDNKEKITPKIFQKGILERLGTPLRESEVAEFFRAVLRAEPSRADGNGQETEVSLSALSWWIERYSVDLASDNLLVGNSSSRGELDTTGRWRRMMYAKYRSVCTRLLG